MGQVATDFHGLLSLLDLPEQQLLPRVPGSHQDAGPGIFSFSNLGAEIGNTSNAHFAEISLIQKFPEIREFESNALRPGLSAQDIDLFYIHFMMTAKQVHESARAWFRPGGPAEDWLFVCLSQAISVLVGTLVRLVEEVTQ